MAIELDISMNAEKAKKSAQDLKTAIDKALSSSDPKLNKMGIQLQKVSNKMTEISSKMKDLETAKPTQAFAKATSDVEKYTSKLNEAKIAKEKIAEKLSSKMSNFSDDYQAQSSVITDNQNTLNSINMLIAKYEKMGKTGTSAYSAKKKQADQLTATLANQRARLQELINSENQFDKTRGSAYYKKVDAIKEMTEKLAEAKAKQQELLQTGQAYAPQTDSSAYKKYQNQASILSTTSKITARDVLDSANIKATFKEVFSTSVATAKTAIQSLKQAFNSVVSSIKNVGKAIKSHISNHTNSASLSLSGLIKKLVRYGLGLRSLYILYKKIRSAGITAFNELANTVPEIKSSVDSLKISFNALKSSLGSAFQPVVSKVIGVLTTLIDYLTSAMNTIGEFFAVLTGQKYVYKSVKNINSVSKAVSGSGSSAKEASKQLAEYDDLLVIDNNDTGGGGGGGGGGGAGSTGEWVKETANNDFAEALKAAIDKGDWEGVGSLIGQKLNVITDTFDDWINNTFVPKGVTWAKNISDVINGIFSDEGYDFSKLGDTLADAFNGINKIVNTFFENTNWEQIGTRLGQTVSHFINNLDAEEWAATVYTKLNAIIGVVDGFVSQLTDTSTWATAGQKLNTALKSIFTNINLAGIKSSLTQIGSGIAEFLNNSITPDMFYNMGTTISSGINTAIESAHNFVSTLDWGQMGTSMVSSLNATLQHTDWSNIAQTLSDSILGLFEYITESINNLDAEALADAIVDFVTGIDWIKVLQAIAIAIFYLQEKILEILFYLIIDVGYNLLEWINDNISQPIGEWLGNIWTSIKSAIGTGWDAVVSVFKTVYNAIISPYKAIGKWFKDKFKEARDGITKIWGSISGWFKDKWEAIVAVYDTVVDYFAGVFSKAHEKVTEPFSSIGGWFKDKWTSIKGAFGDVAGWFGGKFGSAYKGITSAFSGIRSFFSGVWGGITGVFNNVSGWFGNKFGGAYNGLTSAFRGVKSFFSGVWSGITGVFGSVGSFFKSTFSSAWEGVKRVFSSGGTVFAGIKQGIASTFKSIVNSLISGINTVVSTPFSKINSALSKIRNVSILKHKPFSRLPSIPIPRIPYLAQGAVIPPNKQFLAMLGDQKQGTNIETPLETMIQAFRVALNEDGNNNNHSPIVLQLDGKTVAEVVWSENEKRYKQTGYSFGY